MRESVNPKKKFYRNITIDKVRSGTCNFSKSPGQSLLDSCLRGNDDCADFAVMPA